MNWSLDSGSPTGVSDHACSVGIRIRSFLYNYFIDEEGGGETRPSCLGRVLKEDEISELLLKFLSSLDSLGSGSSCVLVLSLSQIPNVLSLPNC